MDCASIAACSVTTGSPKLSWADISDDDVNDGEVTGSAEEEMQHQGEIPRAKLHGTGEAPRANFQGSIARSQHRAAHKKQQQLESSNWTGKSPQGHAFERYWYCPSMHSMSEDMMLPHQDFGASPQGCYPTGSFSVEVDGMPAQLCNDACLDAMLHQGGFQNYVTEVETRHKNNKGLAIIKLSTWPAAVKCYNHFSMSSWSTGALKVRMAPPDWQHSAGGFEWSEGTESGVPAASSSPEQAAAAEANSNPSNMVFNNSEWLAPPYVSGADYGSMAGPYLISPGAHEVAHACAHAYSQEQTSASGQRISCAS